MKARAANENSALAKSGRSPCPMCGEPRAEAYRPFCSKRCANRDLQRWLTGGYSIPVAEQPDEWSEGDD